MPYKDSGTTASFLIVEDDDLDFRILERAFKTLKIANPVRRAVDGIEALEILRGQNGHMPMLTPYIILLDIRMPRMDGIEFLEQIRNDDELNKSVVFVLTTSDAKADIDAVYTHQVAGYIRKSEPESGFLDALTMIDHYWRIVVLPGA
jgi:CheY-like chemotaxis protein